MRSMLNEKRFILVLAVGLVLWTGEARAQMNPQTQALQLNQQAMAAYANLQIPTALALLQQAASICMQYNIRGEALARTYLNMGVIEAGGNQNNASAMEHFKKAVCVDNTILLDPLNSTPEIETLFNMARNQARAAGCAGSQPTPPPPPTVYPPPPQRQPPPQQQPTPPPPQQPPTQSGLLRHQPVTQQLRLIPIPLFVDVNPNVQVGQVVLFYRTLGERIFQQVPMNQHQQGYAATIGCDVLQTFDPTGLEYYIAVLDPGNQLLGTAGTEAQPHRVAVVQTLTIAPPALPGAASPDKCIEDCPPWNPDCNKACKQLGDLCDSSSECCSGMVCVEETCTESEGGGGGDDGDFDPTVRISVAFGTGTGIIPGGDVNPYNQVSKTPNPVYEDHINDPENYDPGQLSISTAFAWSKLHLRLNTMFYLTPKILLGLSFRGGLPLDPHGDVLPIAPTVLASMAFRMVGEGTDKFELDGLVGLGGGIIYHRIPYKDCKKWTLSPGSPWYDDSDGAPDEQYGCSQYYNDESDDEYETAMGAPSWGALDRTTDAWDGVTQAVDKAFFREAGKFVIEAGIDGYIWFVNNFGLNVGIIADIYIPEFALNFDFQLGVALRF